MPAPQIDCLADICGVTPQSLLDLSRSVNQHYHRFGIDKGNGKKRWIEAPSNFLKYTQKQILLEILYKVSPHEAAHGFVPNRSIVTNAEPHVNREWVANFDIKGFFPATKRPLIKDVLSRYTQLNEDERRVVLKLVSKNGVLPQGAPTSPHIANLAMYEADLKMQHYADVNNLKYTRYADDLTFSGDRLPKELRRFIGRSIRPLGYQIASGKSKWLPQSKRQMVTGLVVNKSIGLPRPERKRLRAIIHDAKMRGEDALDKAGLMLCQVEGKIALQMMWDEASARRQLLDLREAIDLDRSI